MKKLCVVAAILAATGASAADLNSGVLAQPEGYRWEGAYVGGNIGGTWANGKAFGEEQIWSMTSGEVSNALSSSFTGGVQIGYNYQIGKLVVGVEGDLNYGGSSSKSEYTANYFSPMYSSFYNVSAEAGVEAYGSLRARLGLAFNQNMMVYATGGLAVGYVKASYSSTFFSSGTVYGSPYYTLNNSSFKVGWVAGAGLEYSLNRKWSLRGEALYMSLGSADLDIGFYQDLTGDIEMGVARAGLNYQF